MLHYCATILCLGFSLGSFRRIDVVAQETVVDFAGINVLLHWPQAYLRGNQKPADEYPCSLPAASLTGEGGRGARGTAPWSEPSHPHARTSSCCCSIIFFKLVSLIVSCVTDIFGFFCLFCFVLSIFPCSLFFLIFFIPLWFGNIHFSFYLLSSHC